MNIYKQEFINTLDAKGVKYTDVDSETVKITYNTDNAPSVSVLVIFDEDGKNFVQFISFEIAKFAKNKEAGVAACNQANADYRWVKFYLDKDTDLTCDMDAYVYEDTCGEVCLSLVKRMVNIIDDNYPMFMKALWS